METYEIIRIASTNPFFDPSGLNINIRGVIRSGSYFYALVPLDDFRKYQDLEDDTLEVLPVWPDNWRLSNEDVSEFAQAVADMIYFKPSNIVNVYYEAVEDLDIGEEVKKFSDVNRIEILNLFRRVKADIHHIWKSLKNEDFASIAQNLPQKEVAVDDIKSKLNGLEYDFSQIYSAVSEWENKKSNFHEISNLGNEIANFQAWLWQLIARIDAIKVLENPYNAFIRLTDRRRGLLDCMDKFNRLLNNAIKRHTPETSFFGFQTMNWRPNFNQSLLILNIMLLWLEPTAQPGITTRINEVIERSDNHIMIWDWDEDGGWDAISSFILNRYQTRATASDLKEQLEYIILQLHCLTGNPKDRKTGKQTSFMTNWLLLCSYSHVFAVIPKKLCFENFSYFKEEGVLEDLCYLLQESSLFSKDLTENILEQGINHLEFLIQDPGNPETGSIESMQRNLTVRQPSKRPSPEPQGPTASKWQNVAVPRSDDPSTVDSVIPGPRSRSFSS